MSEKFFAHCGGSSFEHERQQAMNTTNNNIIDIHHSQIRAGENVRKHFDPVKLRELKESIREHGIQQNLVGYRDPDDAEKIILVAGDRRWKATGTLLEELIQEGHADLAARRAQLPVKIIPPEEVPYAKEIQLIENLQREDITPREEADGYHEMLGRINPATDENYTVKELAAKLAVEEKYIARRLKLRNAPGFLLEAVDERKVAATIAELVGRIPDPKAREAAAKEILNPEHQEVPMSFEQAKAHIEQRFMVSLVSGCPFNRNDADLLPLKLDDAGMRIAGGACEDCPFRSGNIDELREQMQSTTGSSSRAGRSGAKRGIDPNVCTNPGCFRLKVDAHWRALKARKMQEIKAMADGESDPKEKTKKIEALADRFIIEGERAKKVFGGWQGELSYDAAYRRASDQVSAFDLRHNYELADKAPTWKKLAEQVGLPLVTARNPHTGKVETLVEHKAVIEKVRAAAKEDGKKSIFDQRPASGVAGSSNDAKAAREAAKLEVVKAHLGFDALRDAMAREGLDADAMRIVFGHALDHSGADGQMFLGKWLGLEKAGKGGSGPDYGTPVLQHVNQLCGDNVQALLQWTVLALLARDVRWAGLGSETYSALAKHFGIDKSKLDEKARGTRQQAGGKRQEDGKAQGNRQEDGGERDVEGGKRPRSAPAATGDGDAAKTPNLRELVKKARAKKKASAKKRKK